MATPKKTGAKKAGATPVKKPAPTKPPAQAPAKKPPAKKPPAKKPPAKKPGKKPAPRPYPGPIDAVPFELLVRKPDGTATNFGNKSGRTAVELPGDYFAVVLTVPPARRFLHFVQLHDPKKWPVLIQLLDTAAAPVVRIPAEGAWQRPMVVKGTVRVYATDVPLTWEQLLLYAGPHEPAPTPARPPYM